MGRLFVALWMFAIVVLAAPARIAGAAEPATPSGAVLRIGVFDSRVVALAYGRSAAFTERIETLKREFAKAQAANDAPRVQELGKELGWTQVRMHQRVFSTAGTAAILATVADRLPALAREAGVALIVSKWEMPYADPSIEKVDVTTPLAMLFRPDTRTVGMFDEFRKTPPVPFDELGLDPNE